MSEKLKNKINENNGGDYMSVLDEFMRQEKFINPTKSEELKKELSLDFDNFNQPAIKEDNLALAQLILNLLIMQPGTYPDTPEMGIDIASYLFEFLNTDTITKIQNKIEEQIDLYIPSNNIQKILVMKNNNKYTGKTELIIGFSLANITDKGTLATKNTFIRIANDEISGLKTQILD